MSITKSHIANMYIKNCYFYLFIGILNNINQTLDQIINH